MPTHGTGWGGPCTGSSACRPALTRVWEVVPDLSEQMERPVGSTVTGAGGPGAETRGLRGLIPSPG